MAFTQRVSSWFLVLVAATVAAGILGLVVWNRWGRSPSLESLLGRLPDRHALTVHINFAELRKAGLAELMASTPVAEDPDYLGFVTESGFDWKTDLDAVTATKAGDDWYCFAVGRFDMEKLRNYAISRRGNCRNGICSVPGTTPGRQISFYPAGPRMLALASSKSPLAVYNLQRKPNPEWVGGVPQGPAWFSLNGSILEGDPVLPAGGRLFGKILAGTERTTFSVVPGAAGLEVRMRSFSSDPAGAGNIKVQLEGVTKEFKSYFGRLGQPASPADLSGLLLAGEFGINGNEVTGRWPVHEEFLKKLVSGGL